MFTFLLKRGAKVDVAKNGCSVLMEAVDKNQVKRKVPTQYFCSLSFPFNKIIRDVTSRALPRKFFDLQKDFFGAVPPLCPHTYKILVFCRYIILST